MGLARSYRDQLQKRLLKVKVKVKVCGPFVCLAIIGLKKWFSRHKRNHFFLPNGGGHALKTNFLLLYGNIHWLCEK